MKTKNMLLAVAATLSFAGCIENNIPYPIVEAGITALEVEGQRAAIGGSSTAATIDKNNRMVELYVDDQVDLTNLQITKLMFTETAKLCVIDSLACANYSRFPRASFSSAAELSTKANTRVDFSRPVRMRLVTYQEYDWTVWVHQIVERAIDLDGQIGNAVIDDVNHNVVIYVSSDKDLSKLAVNKFDLGGEHGKVIPNPTDYSAFDFSKACTFFVSRGWENVSRQWTVYVYPKDATAAQTTASAFPMSTRATITGQKQSGKTVGVEYKQQGSGSWRALPASAIVSTGVSFTATLSGLTPATKYQYRILTNGEAGDEQALTTAPAPQLTDGDFDNWHSTVAASRKNLWNPWQEGKTSFWDTGNKGATTVGDSNSIPTDETCNGQGKAALLESKFIVLKFAAGNMFTGEYVETDGTNGILDFGREFTGFPSKLRVNYKYTTSTINRSADKDYEYLKTRPDSCQIYIALADWDEPYRIRTKPTERRLFDPNDPGVIAYAQMTVGDNVTAWTQTDLVLDYKAENRTPKYILVVASASKYGDFFTGGEGSKLWIDNFELIYD